MRPEDIPGYLARAEELLKVSRVNLENNFPADSVNRSYYAMFHAATALLLSIGVERSSHKGLVSAFGEFIVNKGILEHRFQSYFRKAFEARSDSDYLPMPGDTKENADLMLQRAVEFVAACKTLLKEKGR